MQLTGVRSWTGKIFQRKTTSGNQRDICLSFFAHTRKVLSIPTFIQKQKQKPERGEAFEKILYSLEKKESPKQGKKFAYPSVCDLKF